MHYIYYIYYIFQKISIPTRGGSLEIPRGRVVLKANIFKRKYETKLDYPAKKNPVGGV